jgi:hypothetical protein
LSELLYVFYHEKGEEGHRVEAGNAGGMCWGIGIKEKWESLCLLVGFCAILIGMEHRDYGLLKIPMPGESLHRTICIEKA